MQRKFDETIQKLTDIWNEAHSLEPFSNEHGTMEKHRYRIKNIPLQKWLNINVSVNDNNLDVFINGKLKRSFIVPGIVPTPSGSLALCPNGGFDGFISNSSYANRQLDQTTIRKIYQKGPYKTGAIETTNWFKNLYLFRN